jgi:hypothetical protein
MGEPISYLSALIIQAAEKMATTSDPERSSERPSTASETSACSSDDPPESD